MMKGKERHAWNAVSMLAMLLSVMFGVILDRLFGWVAPTILISWMVLCILISLKQLHDSPTTEN